MSKSGGLLARPASILNLNSKAIEEISLFHRKLVVCQMHFSFNNMLAVAFSDDSLAEKKFFVRVFNLDKLLSGDNYCLHIPIEHPPDMMLVNTQESHHLIYRERRHRENDVIMVRSVNILESGHPEGKCHHHIIDCET